MGTVVVAVILLVCIVFAIRESIRHMKGEGGCCGGGDVAVKVKRQNLHQVVCTKRMLIEGMSCDNCRKRVENELNSLKLVNAKVNLKRKEAVVKLGQETSDACLKEAVERIGYQVVSITVDER